MTRKERWLVIPILFGSLLAGIALALQPAVLQQKIGLVAGVVLIPLLMLRMGALALDASRKRRLVLAAFCGLLVGLFFLGLLGELDKLLKIFAG